MVTACSARLEAEGSVSPSPLGCGHAGGRGVLYELDRQIIVLAERAYPWAVRIALFVVYFWFGFVKLIGLSEATGLAKALTAQTVGLAHFQVLFTGLALFECVIGVLCLIPRATRLVLVLLIVHMATVCAPLLLVRDMTWQTTLVPTMDGQYIIKNVLIIAAAFGLAARNAPYSANLEFSNRETGSRSLLPSSPKSPPLRILSSSSVTIGVARSATVGRPPEPAQRSDSTLYIERAGEAPRPRSADATQAAAPARESSVTIQRARPIDLGATGTRTGQRRCRFWHPDRPCQGSFRH